MPRNNALSPYEPIETHVRMPAHEICAVIRALTAGDRVAFIAGDGNRVKRLFTYEVSNVHTDGQTVDVVGPANGLWRFEIVDGLPFVAHVSGSQHNTRATLDYLERRSEPHV
jgi:hypothetical protein